jgi:hypothetical protein
MLVFFSSDASTDKIKNRNQNSTYLPIQLSKTSQRLTSETPIDTSRTPDLSTPPTPPPTPTLCDPGAVPPFNDLLPPPPLRYCRTVFLNPTGAPNSSTHCLASRHEG